MKKIIIVVIAACSIYLLSGCNKFLDQVPDDRLTLEEVFKNKSTAENFLASVYSVLPREHSQRFVGAGNGGPWTGAADEGEYLWGFVPSNAMNIGNWDANSGFVGDFWSTYYKAIRSATYFIANVDKVTADITPELKIQYKAEARALRGMYYFYLLRLYGPVVILGDSIVPVDAPFQDVQLPRNSMDECVDFVSNELEKAAADLPVTSSNSDNIGRITKPIALAFKAQTLLLNASPLFNGNTAYANLKNNDGKQLINQVYDVNKWEKAATAYKDFITRFVPGIFDLYKVYNSDGTLNPYLSCRNVILEDFNKEIIFARQDNDNARNYDVTPYHQGAASEYRGSGGLGATQKQVDAFFMENGLPITDANSGYKAMQAVMYKTPYEAETRETFSEWAFREPRFYVNITYDGSRWINTNSGAFYTRLYFRGNSGKGTSNDYCPTGYVVRKGAPSSDWRRGEDAIPMYRLANIYLDYIEALNEYKPSDPDILKYLNMIRERAGIPGYGQGLVTLPADQAAMRQAIRRERQVELCFENVRYFDTRRWKIAEQEDNGPMYGCDIDAGVPQFYVKKALETRVFNQRHYLWPIPQGDVNIDAELVQNPLW